MSENYFPGLSKVRVVVFLLHLQLFACLCERNAPTSNPYYNPDHIFVSGRTVQYLPDPIFYDTYIPILFKVPIPKHTDGALRLNYGDANSCSKPNGGNFCPISYHLHKVISQLGDDMSFWKPYYVNHTSTKKESLKRRVGFEVICNEISSHFFRSYTSQLQLESYVRALKACSRFPNSVHLYYPPGKWVVDKNVYYRMMASYKSKYFSNLPSKGNEDWAIYLNTYTSVNGLLLANHVMESVRLGTALRICQQGLIPETFVSMDTLKGALEKVSNSLKKWNYELVYKDLVHDLEEYYQLPLADCTFSDEFSFYIRVLAPIRRSGLFYKLVEINTIPFLEKLPESSGIPERLCRLKLPAAKMTLIEADTGLLLDTTCEPSKLCKTSEVLSVFENDACTTSLLTDDPQIITNTCKFSCFTVDKAALPIIRRVRPDTYVIVGDETQKVHLNCFDKPKELIPVELKNVGAMRIKLACNCQILYLNHVSYRPRDPCFGKTTVEHIYPYHWYSKIENASQTVERETLEPIKVQEAQETTTTPPPTPSPTPPKTMAPAPTTLKTPAPTTTPPVAPVPTTAAPVAPTNAPTRRSEEFSETIDGSTSTPMTTTSAPVDTSPDSEADPDAAEVHSSDSTPEFTGDIDDKLIEKSILQQEAELESKFRPRIDHHPISSCNQLSDGLIVQLCFLWILLLTLGTVMLYMAYHLRRLMKWKELQAYKDTRIIYRIPPETPSDENNKIIRDGSSGGVRVAWDAFYDLFSVH